MRVLPINTHTRADLLAAPPVGAACVATAAAAAGHEVRLLDLCFARDRGRELRDTVASFHGTGLRRLLRPRDVARHIQERVAAQRTAVRAATG